MAWSDFIDSIRRQHTRNLTFATLPRRLERRVTGTALAPLPLILFISCKWRNSDSSCSCASPKMHLISESNLVSARKYRFEGKWMRHVGHSFFPFPIHSIIHRRQKRCMHSFTMTVSFRYDIQIGQRKSGCNSFNGTRLRWASGSILMVRGFLWMS